MELLNEDLYKYKEKEMGKEIKKKERNGKIVKYIFFKFC